MEWSIILPIFAGTLIILFPVAFVWYICVSGMFTAFRRKSAAGMTCSVDTDCPPGYMCIGGYCVPDKA